MALLAARKGHREVHPTSPRPVEKITLGPARHILLNPVDRDRAARKVIGSFPGTRKSDGPDILSALILVEGRELDAAPLHGALKPQAGRRLPSTGVTHTIPLRPAHLAAAVLLVGGPLRRHHRRLQRLQRLRHARTLIRPDASIRAVVFLRAPGNADRRWELSHIALVARTEHPVRSAVPRYLHVPHATVGGGASS